MSIPRSDTEPVPAEPEDCLAEAERLVESGSIAEALPHLEAGVRRLEQWVRATQIDVVGGDSYARPQTQDRLAALRERITRLIARLEAARREVEDEFRTVRSQRAFERQEQAPAQSWFESQA